VSNLYSVVMPLLPFAQRKSGWTGAFETATAAPLGAWPHNNIKLYQWIE